MNKSEMHFLDSHKDAFLGGAIVCAFHNIVSTPSTLLLYGETFHGWLLGTALKCFEVALYGLIGGFVGMLGKRLFNYVNAKLELYFKNKK